MGVQSRAVLTLLSGPPHVAALMGWKMLLNESATPVQSLYGEKALYFYLELLSLLSFPLGNFFWYSMYLFRVNSKNWVNVII